MNPRALPQTVSFRTQRAVGLGHHLYDAQALRGSRTHTPVNSPALVAENPSSTCHALGKLAVRFPKPICAALISKCPESPGCRLTRICRCIASPSLFRTSSVSPVTRLLSAPRGNSLCPRAWGMCDSFSKSVHSVKKN